MKLMYLGHAGFLWDTREKNILLEIDYESAKKQFTNNLVNLTLMEIGEHKELI